MPVCEPCGGPDDVFECYECSRHFCVDCHIGHGWFRLNPHLGGLYGYYGCFLCKKDPESAVEANLKCADAGWACEKDDFTGLEPLDEPAIKKKLKKLKSNLTKATVKKLAAAPARNALRVFRSD